MPITGEQRGWCGERSRDQRQGRWVREDVGWRGPLLHCHITAIEEGTSLGTLLLALCPLCVYTPPLSSPSFPLSPTCFHHQQSLLTIMPYSYADTLHRNSKRHYTETVNATFAYSTPSDHFPYRSPIWHSFKSP